MNFDQVISELFEHMQFAWNNKQFDDIAELLEDDVTASVESVKVGNITIQSQKIIGKKEVLAYAKKIRNTLPLKYEFELPQKPLSKSIQYRKYYYQIKVWAYFESTISEYGKFKEFSIVRYENTESNKISAFNMLRNIVSYKLKSIFSGSAS